MQLVETSQFETPLEVTNVLTYIGGYLINKLKKSDFPCEHCLSELSEVDSNVVEDSDLYIHLRAYSHTKGAFGGLTAPSTGLTKILQQVEKVFGRSLVSSCLLQDITEQVCDQVAMTTLDVCSNHTDIVKILCVMYLNCCVYHYFKYETRHLVQVKKEKRKRNAQPVLHALCWQSAICLPFQLNATTGIHRSLLGDIRNVAQLNNYSIIVI